MSSLLRLAKANPVVFKLYLDPNTNEELGENRKHAAKVVLGVCAPTNIHQYLGLKQALTDSPTSALGSPAWPARDTVYI